MKDRDLRAINLALSKIDFIVETQIVPEWGGVINDRTVTAVYVGKSPEMGDQYPHILCSTTGDRIWFKTAKVEDDKDGDLSVVLEQCWVEGVGFPIRADSVRLIRSGFDETHPDWRRIASDYYKVTTDRVEGQTLREYACQWWWVSKEERQRMHDLILGDRDDYVPLLHQ